MCFSFEGVMLNQKGFSLTEVIIAVGLASLVSLISYQIVFEGYRLNKKVEGVSGLNDIRQNIYEAFKNPSAFANTVANPTNAAAFACINNATDCAAAGGVINLLDGSNAVVRGASRNGTNDGFDFSGALCGTFNLAGNDNCPFRYVISWSPKCPLAPATCINPLIKLSATLQFRPVDKSKFAVINESQFNININRPNKKASYTDACTKVGGTMISATQCQLAYVNVSCPPNNWVIGFAANGAPICNPIVGHACPKGQVLLGVDAAGVAHCGPGCFSLGSGSGSIW